MVPDCHGTRLRPESPGMPARRPRHPHEITALSVKKTRGHSRVLCELSFRRSAAGAEPIVAEIHAGLAFLDLEWARLSELDRTADTSAVGERQRVRLATGIGAASCGSSLPARTNRQSGIHPRDNDRLIARPPRLQQQGNTVVVVEARWRR